MPNTHDAALFAASINPKIRTVDLHAYRDIKEACDTLEHELFLCAKKKERSCRVVHGIGAGVLAQAVHDVLDRNPLVLAWKEDESGGSCVVVFG